MKSHATIFTVGGLWILLSGVLLGQGPIVGGGMGMYPAGDSMAAYPWDAGTIAAEGGYLGGLADSGFADGGAGCDACLMRPARGWGRVEYLLWWTQDRFVPTLASTSPNGTPRDQAGRLDEPDTSILFGGRDLSTGPHSGFGLETGYWLTPRQLVGIGGRYRWIGEDSESFHGSSTGDPILARPFFNTQTNAADALLVAYPGVAEGSLSTKYAADLQLGDTFLRWLLYVGYGNRLDLIGGYQRAKINDEVLINHQITSVEQGGPVPVGTVVRSRDQFRAENEFHGGFVGLLAEGEDGCLVWRLLTKVAFGNMEEKVRIDGSTTTTAPGGPADNDSFGLLALPTNIGTYEANEFAIMPELDLSVRYQMTCRLAFTAGYQFIYWTDTALAGRIVDTTINPSQINGSLTGQPRPRFQQNDDSFWVQGLSLGAEYRY